MQTEVYC